MFSLQLITLKQNKVNITFLRDRVENLSGVGAAVDVAAFERTRTHGGTLKNTYLSISR